MVYNVWCMIRTQIYLPEELKKELKYLAQKEKKPVSEIIRRAVSKEVKKKQENAGETLLKIASYAKEGPGDLSTNLFDYLYGEKSDYRIGKKKPTKK